MRMMFLSLLISAVMAGPAAAASNDPVISWGKPGVPYATYRVDAITCGAQGYFKDISDTQPAREFVEASSRYDSRLTTASNSLDMAIDLARIVRGLRPEKRMDEVGEILQNTVDSCLLDRGYIRFRLTDAQRQRLAQFEKGSPERHAFLHRLGSNPTILSSQVEALMPASR